MQNWEEVQLAVAALRQRLGAALPSRPDAAIILGTGLSGLVERMEDTVSVPYADLPGFPVSTVASHAGAFVLGRLGGRTVLVQQGRCHLYEGFGPDKVCMGVRVMAGLGADTLILTNAAGAPDPQHAAGGVYVDLLVAVRQDACVVLQIQLAAAHHLQVGQARHQICRQVEQLRHRVQHAAVSVLSIPLHTFTSSRLYAQTSRNMPGA